MAGRMGESAVRLQKETPETADDLLRRCASGDRHAFRLLYETESPRLKAVALRITRSAAVAEDVLHDVFVKVWRDAAGFDPARGAARSWLTTKVRFRAMEVMRRAGREMPGLDLAESEDDAPDALTRLLRNADGRALHACLAELDESKRDLIHLAFIKGLSHADLAAETGMPLGTVKSTIRRSLMLLRWCLDR
jgi:RNA polymerase sigma-70 factor (ECF subfamily)